MKIVDCHWELANLGRRTVEITVDSIDVFDSHVIKNAIAEYEYAVVKVPMAMTTFNLGLSAMGFVCIEMQMNVSCRCDTFDLEQRNSLCDKVSFCEVNTREGLDTVISNITPGMFSTDRIAVDPIFGLEVSHRRYINWLKSEYISGQSKLISLYYEGKHIGFMLLRIKGKEADLLLNGLYKPYQGKGLGLLSTASPLLYARYINTAIETERTSISSNNIPVVKLYNHLHFALDSQTYVFVTHLSENKK